MKNFGKLSLVHDRQRHTGVYRPLERMELQIAPGLPAGACVSIEAGDNTVYFSGPAKPGKIGVTVRGTLGEHHASIRDAAGKVLAEQRFRVDTRTRLETSRTDFAKFFNRLEVVTAPLTPAGRRYVDGDIMHFYVHWLRDDTYCQQAFKYWEKEVKDLPQFFLDTQAPDGMIYDNFEPIEMSGMRSRLKRGVKNLKLYRNQLVTRDQRESDTEFLMVASVYAVWQAGGDDLWMQRALPKLERAMLYSMTSPMRWSKPHQLVIRGFTIDTWDFEHSAGGKLRPGSNRSTFPIEKHPKCIMHGDNSGMYQACRQLAGMYAYLGDQPKAAYWLNLAERFRKNTDRVCWNGRFYTHQVHLDPFPGDFGVDESRILSMSNTYDMNRGLPDHKKCASIIREYLARRKESRRVSFAEWFTIHPAFGDGFGGHLKPGDYMNGGVTTIVAGELAKAAFSHGYEAYGVDILKRLRDMLNRDGRLYAVYHPSSRPPDWVKCRYTTLNLRKIANRDFDACKQNGWLGEKMFRGYDLSLIPKGRRTFQGIPFDVIDPAANAGRGILMLKGGLLQHLTSTASVEAVNQKAASVYFLHSYHGPIALNQHIATYIVRYADGQSVSIPIVNAANVWVWKQFREENLGELRGKAPVYRVAWSGKSRLGEPVGVCCFGWANPFPDKTISSITFESMNRGIPIILAVTLSSGPVQMEWGPVSFGIPHNWGTAAIVSAMVEGLAGITDNLKVFDDVTIAPRWLAAGEDRASAAIRYEASNGYAAYALRHNARRRRIGLDFTGSGKRFRFHVMLPAGCRATQVKAGGNEVPLKNIRVEQTPYVDFILSGAGAPVTIDYA